MGTRRATSGQSISSIGVHDRLRGGWARCAFAVVGTIYQNPHMSGDDIGIWIALVFVDRCALVGSHLTSHLASWICACGWSCVGTVAPRHARAAEQHELTERAASCRTVLASIL
mmetsp:Transcript_57027/g.156612  ORF Transcript_57027/g.156612 Transcript_57027/m.156612 type:complete len:114 (+) Transcript_57027:820-1161(+)|eukprot:6525379-Prymnesium_polylepis.2